jgi:hypothetical protein
VLCAGVLLKVRCDYEKRWLMANQSSFMKPPLAPFALLLACLSVLSCVGLPASDRPILNFYRQAWKHYHSHSVTRPMELGGLRIAEDIRLKRLPRYPSIDESVIVIRDPNPSESEVVVLFVSPRVSGSFLDPILPSE